MIGYESKQQQLLNNKLKIKNKQEELFKKFRPDVHN